MESPFLRPSAFGQCMVWSGASQTALYAYTNTRVHRQGQVTTESINLTGTLSKAEGSTINHYTWEKGTNQDNSGRPGRKVSLHTYMWVFSIVVVFTSMRSFSPYWTGTTFSSSASPLNPFSSEDIGLPYLTLSNGCKVLHGVDILQLT